MAVTRLGLHGAPAALYASFAGKTAATVIEFVPPFSAHGSWGLVTAEGVSGKTAADGTRGVTTAVE